MRITYDSPAAVEDILEVKERLARKIYKTGMLCSDYLSERCRGEIFPKSESIQRTGSLKIRGVLDKLNSLIEAKGCKGVMACSASNHAQGVSLSCAMLGIDGKVMMPKGAPRSKVAVTCDYSAEVVLHGDNFNNAIVKVSETVEAEGRILIPPYDDPKVITGQGTIGLETLEDLYNINSVIVPTDNGEPIVGVVVAIKSINPITKIIGVQSKNVHSMVASFHAEEITTHRTAGTLVDGCDIFRPGTLTYEIVHKLMDDTVLVSENEIRNNMVALIRRSKAVTEGAGALACVVLSSRKLGSYIQNKETVSIISGGNIDLSRVSQITGLVDA